MKSKQELLDNVSRLKSELKQAQEDFEIHYGSSESEIKIAEFLNTNKGGATASYLAQRIRAFNRIGKETRKQIIEKMVSNEIIEPRIVSTPSGRGRPSIKYLLVTADD